MTTPVIPPTFDNPKDAKAQAKTEKAYRKAQRPIYQKKRFILPVGFVVLFFLIGIVGSLGGAGGKKANTPTPQAVVPAVSTAPATAAPTVDQAQLARDRAAAAAQVKADAAKAKADADAQARADAKAEADAKAKADAAKRAEAIRLANLPTTAQEQAIQSAQSYLEMSGFSRLGLLKQLTSKYGEGFTKADAVYAVDHIKVDWNQQAVESAKSYLEQGGFSRAGLIQQLTSPYGEQFTVKQATYAVNKVGL